MLRVYGCITEQHDFRPVAQKLRKIALAQCAETGGRPTFHDSVRQENDVLAVLVGTDSHPARPPSGHDIGGNTLEMKLHRINGHSQPHAAFQAAIGEVRVAARRPLQRVGRRAKSDSGLSKAAH